MSTIVGYVNKNGVWIGSDSMASTDSGDIRLIVTNKLFRNEKYLIGGTGSVRGCQLLQEEYFEPPEEVFLFGEAIRLHFKELGCLTLSPDDKTEAQPNNFLIGCEGKLYEILIDFQINEIVEYTSIGAGSQYALGSLYTTRKTNLTPEQKIKLALQSAAFFDTSTGPPFIIEKL
ncbi:MAG: hypothetical protein ACFFG0_00260 [Candidatus Thorarchaeota archaeon]